LGIALLVVLAFFIASGCARDHAQTSSPSPHASPQTAAYASPELGISFRYPASWQAATQMAPAADPRGGGDVKLHGPGGVAFGVAVTGKSVANVPFDAKGQLALDRRSAKAEGARIVAQSVIEIAGEPFARTDRIVNGRHAVVIVGSLASGRLVGMGFNCPKDSWPAQRRAMEAVVQTMRFSTPKASQG
jgi:hypothetical protein